MRRTHSAGVPSTAMTSAMSDTLTGRLVKLSESECDLPLWASAGATTFSVISGNGAKAA